MKTKTPVNPNERLLTTAEAAPLLRLSVWTTKEKCAAKLIKATKPGRVWLIPESAVAEYLTRSSN